ncbi:MAG TPA: SDR family NAD(P)-dependent oxidoreductase [Acetobacteraceae bacterium]|nr:SDR family NAD(P)-dependent oxidoreductase [Acetobacteraceae bacterium]
MIRFDDRVAIVTGAGRGLGRAHALGLAARGARVLVSDLPENGAPSAASRAVVAEIEAAGGVAQANAADVSNAEAADAAVAQALAAWGRVDIVVNNAGILRDKSFAKLSNEDFEAVWRVHVLGSAYITRAAWPAMREQKYGRVLFTSSASGIYGNFGQANYAAAKAAMIGLMNVLHLEGIKYDIRVNSLVPSAATAMTNDLLPPTALDLMAPETVTPAVLFLCGEDAPSRVIMSAGAGVFDVTHIEEGPGVFLPTAERTPETIAARFPEIASRADLSPVSGALEQTQKFIALALEGANKTSI